MFIRSLSFLLLMVGVAAFPSAGVAQAHGLPLRGQVIGVAPVSGTTGNCSCVYQWYTIGLRSGPVEVSTELRGYTNGYGPTYGMRVFLYHGETLLSSGQVGCFAKQRHCNQFVRMHARIKSASPYYLRVEGPGADGVMYTLRVTGHVYGLRCGKYC